jgi:hypothetical protein
LARRDREWLLNDGQIQNPSNPFGIVPLSNFAPRGFAFVHHSIAIFSIAPCQTLISRLATFPSQYDALRGAAGEGTAAQLVLNDERAAAAHATRRSMHARAQALRASLARQDAVLAEMAGSLEYGDGKVANREIRVWHGATEEGP